MAEFKVVDILKMEGSVMRNRALAEDLTWRETNSLYLSCQGRRKGTRKLEVTPNVIRQDDENFIEVETINTLV